MAGFGQNAQYKAACGRLLPQKHSAGHQEQTIMEQIEYIPVESNSAALLRPSATYMFIRADSEFITIVITYTSLEIINYSNLVD